MTFSATTGKVSYDGDGATTAFPTVFKFVVNGHVKAILRDAADLETPWAEGTDYTLAGAGQAAGGTQSATVAPAAGEKLVLILDVPFTQEKSLPLGGAFPSTQVEEGLDLAVQGSAKLAEVDRRTLKVPETDDITGADLDLPIDSARAGKFLAFDQFGKPTPAVGTSGDLSPVSAFMDTVLPSADAAAARGTLDAQRDLKSAGLIATRGDLVVGDATPAPARLAKGAANRFLAADANDVGYFGGTLARTADYTVLPGDHGKLILVDTTAGPATITLPAAATAGDGFRVAVKKTDATANAVTVDGNAAETIDGAATRVLSVQHDVEAYECDGSGWHAVVEKLPVPGLVLISSVVAANDAAVEFTTGIDGTFDGYEFVFADVIPATDNVQILLEVSTDGGTTWKTGATDYSYSGIDVTINTVTPFGANDATRIEMTVNGIGSDVGEAGVSGRVEMHGPANAAVVQQFRWDFVYDQSGAFQSRLASGGGAYETAEAINGVRFRFTSGNVESGRISLYGRRHA
jgi:hypothetical protein